MELQDLGNIGEFVAAIATIATLFYLALQIRQSTKATRASAYDAILQQWREHLRENFTAHPTNLEIWRKGLTSFENLDAGEKARFAFILSQEQLFIENMVQQQERGNINADMLRPWLDYFSRELRTPGGRAWWAMVTATLNPAFVEIMEKHLSMTAGQSDLIEELPVFRY